MPLAQELETARKHNLDLVEVAPTVSPPVCRLLDYGKYRYAQAKKVREARKGQKISLLREVRLRPKIGSHDFDFKARVVRKLLGDGDKVKVVVMFRGREITHPDIGANLLRRMSETVKDVASLDGQQFMEGKRMRIIFSPAPTAHKPKAREEVKETSNAQN